MSAPSITQSDLVASLPDVTSSFRLRGLEGSVEVHRDGYGIPHVRARSVHDAFFAQGFVTAQDRLWHMEYDRRRACGRWAEFAPQNDGVAQDVLARRMRLAASARADYRSATPKARSMLDAYAAGVNAFLRSTERLPIEYRIVGAEPEPWQPWHSLAVFKVRHALMGVFEMKLWRAMLLRRLGPERAAALFPGYEEGHLLILPPGATSRGPEAAPVEHFARLADALRGLGAGEGGSNNWVLAGSRTARGAPLVAGDPHRGLDTPNVYYQNHVACPEFDVAGLSFPGVPGFPHFGHNRSVAWCVTHAMADYQDLYIERFKRGAPHLYLFRGRWRRARLYPEVVKVRGAPDVSFDVAVTHHGPVIAGEPSQGYGIAFRYTATVEPCTFAETLLPMLRSSSADELEEAMRPWVEPCNNFVFADTAGNIGYRTRGKVPVRSMANAWLPVPGWTGQHEWQGYIPFEEMPRSRNPEQGYIVTANNRIVGKDYPHYLGTEYAPEFRARRIADRLLALRKATVEDLASVHSEATSIPAQRFKPLLAGMRARGVASAAALTRLLAWDCVMAADRVEPTIYSAFRDELLRRVLEPLLGPLAAEAFSGSGRGGPRFAFDVRSRLHTMIQQDDRSLLPAGEDWDSLMAEALQSAVAGLRRDLGSDMNTWLWGRVHRTRPRHTLSNAFSEMAALLDPPSIPMGGDGETPMNGSYHIGQGFTVSACSAARYVFDLGDWDNSRWAIPLGASGHPGSLHYADQAPVWGKVQLVPMLYDWKRIEGNAETRQALRPYRRARR